MLSDNSNEMFTTESRRRVRALGDPRGYYHSTARRLYYYAFPWDRKRVGAHLRSDVRMRSKRFYFIIYNMIL